MTKFKLGLAASVAAILAFGVAACGQTTAVEEPAAEVEAPAEVPAEVPADAAPPADGAATAPADGATTTPPATTP